MAYETLAAAVHASPETLRTGWSPPTALLLALPLPVIPVLLLAVEKAHRGYERNGETSSAAGKEEASR